MSIILIESESLNANSRFRLLIGTKAIFINFYLILKFFSQPKKKVNKGLIFLSRFKHSQSLARIRKIGIEGREGREGQTDKEREGKERKEVQKDRKREGK
jgi:hypothetical protein